MHPHQCLSNHSTTDHDETNLASKRKFDTSEIRERKWVKIDNLVPSYSLSSVPKGEDLEGNIIEIDHDTIKLLNLISVSN